MSLSPVLALVDRGLVPDGLLRVGIRRLLRQRLAEERGKLGANADGLSNESNEFLSKLRASPIALATAEANQQHYEVPASFFELVLGPRLKYSSGYWPAGTTTLAESEEAMLALAAERAQIADGQRILDLGSGWGSFGLWLAERYPASEILAVSNSQSQGEWIRAAAARRGLSNIRHQVANVAELELEKRFDRVVSVEMFEHMRNYDALLAKIARWLTPEGRLFVHIFCNRGLSYPFEDGGPSDWMARHFFTGGLMPSIDLLPRFDRDLVVEDRWSLSGTHYQRTSEAWLENLDRHRAQVRALFDATYGGKGALWVERWRVFFLSCSELFGWNEGSEWLVAHYRFRHPR
ncbi:MAG: cyclopropane-fatty-acyl-phospholipid synthase family protein [Acidobacteriota bacterium]